MDIIQATTIGQLREYLYAADDEREIAQGEWGHGSNVLSTFSVASCVVLAAHNSASRRGLLGHFSCISPTAKLAPELLNEQSDTGAFAEAVDFIPRLGPASSTHIWLGGAALYDTDHSSIKNITVADRLYAEAGVGELANRYNVTDETIEHGWNMTEYDLYIRLNNISGSLLIQPITE